ncbi:uncharacterized protein LOC113351166 [Papaver somniferum]|uniref:uncharacterized protein LOC113351166 n=1 Tax=Papaver somniferum TaxID=3469 RepID=UPI000E704DBC|nr:uncharacterized protein LOC113351166 [Papaver somniferum]
MPSHHMEIFKIPETTIKEMDKLQRDFCWNKPQGGGIYITRWPRMCRDKATEGLGFRDLHCFNQALLAKAAWRLCQQQQQLCAIALKERYFPLTNVLHAKKKKNSTWAWNNIQGMMDFVKNWSFWIVGDGRKIQTWKDNWIIGKHSPPVQEVDSDEAQRYVTVNNLIDSHTKSWKVDIVRRLFNSEDVEKILQICLTESEKID